MQKGGYKEKLKLKMNKFVHLVYRVSRNFPTDEKFGATSQSRRASLSIILNYIESFARRKRLVQLNFLEISYGFLKESKYLLHFSLVEKYINKEEYLDLYELSEEIGAMLWTEIRSLDRSVKE